MTELGHGLLKLAVDLQEHCARQEWYEAFDFKFTATIAEDKREALNPPRSELGLSAASVLERIRKAN